MSWIMPPWLPRCIEIRGVKVSVSQIDIPVSYSADFEGERVRREDTQWSLGGKYSTAFEFVHMKGDGIRLRMQD